MDSLAFGLTYAISAFAAAIGAGMVPQHLTQLAATQRRLVRFVV